MAETKIEWCDAVWNPATGCIKVSEGCRNCYAERLWTRLKAMNKDYTDRNFNDVKCHPERLGQPLKWRKPRRIFVNSMSDLFHESVPDEFIIEALSIMAQAKKHTFQILTKRPERMKELFNIKSIAYEVWMRTDVSDDELDDMVWPLPNVWLGVSVENQATADERIPLLLQTPAAVKFISAEPLLGPVSLRWLSAWKGKAFNSSSNQTNELDGLRCLDWVIVGGESGPGARPMHPDWVRSLRDQCQAAGVPFFFKQWGEWLPSDIRCSEEYPNNWHTSHETQLEFGGVKNTLRKVGREKAGRLLDGRTWEELPEIGGTHA